MKNAYRRIVLLLENLILKIHIFKTWIFEWYSILRKKSLYKDIHYTNEKSLEIKKIWESNYGKAISNRWHKLYQSINGIYNKCYFPEIIFSTKLEPILNPINIAKHMSDKSITELFYKSVPNVKFPCTIIVNCSGYYYDKDRNVISNNEAINILMDFDEFVIKPTFGGSSGQGVQVITLKDVSDSGKKEIIVELLTGYRSNFIVQHKLNGHLEYSNLYPYAVNTVRLITYICNDTVYHAPLCLRMGCAGNKVDNIHAGGIVVGLSDSGILKKYGYQLGYGDSKTKFTSHPDTNIQFEGYQVPKTLEMINIAKRLHCHTPHLGIISWDLMVDSVGDVILVEGNYYGQSIWFPQIAHGEPIFGEQTEYMMNILK
jgi:hypothetical protein